MIETPTRVVAEMESERAARNLLTVFAGELEATYDTMRDEYRYTRGDTKMRLALRKTEKTGLATIVYIQEVTDHTG